jgi:solute carrier family 25, member 34/35
VVGVSRGSGEWGGGGGGLAGWLAGLCVHVGREGRSPREGPPSSYDSKSFAILHAPHNFTRVFTPCTGPLDAHPRASKQALRAAHWNRAHFDLVQQYSFSDFLSRVPGTYTHAHERRQLQLHRPAIGSRPPSHRRACVCAHTPHPHARPKMASPPNSPLPPLRLAVVPSFAASAMAACSACVFTNPMEVIKTRLQLDGEGAKVAKSERQYRGIGHAFTSILRTEGLRGLQSGLTPALGYQVTMNGCRLGLYEPVQAVLREQLGVDTTHPAAKALSGALSGAVGATLGSPLYLVKSRLQAQSTVFKAKEAHAYAGVRDAFAQIYRAEGVRGLFRGVDGALPRVMCGSATQLSSYDSAKSFIGSGWRRDVVPAGLPQHFAASLIASFLTVTVMNPLDVVSTRLYQSAGRATHYTGPVDCLVKTVRAEGLGALQKGWLAQYARLGPHTILTFVFLEQVKPLFLAVPAFTVR